MKKILLHTCCAPCSIMPLQNLLEDNFLVTAYFFNPNIHLKDEYQYRFYAMKKLAKTYNIPFVFGEYNEYHQEIFLSLQEENLNPAEVYKNALKECTSFLYGKIQEKENEAWKNALHITLKKWKDYTKNFQVSPNENNCSVPDYMTWVGHLQSSASSFYMTNFTEGERCKLCYQERFYQTALYAAQNNFESFTSTLLYSRYQNHDHICQAAENAKNLINKKFNVNLCFYYKDFRSYWQEGIDKSKEKGMYRQKWCGCAISRLESLERMAKRCYEKKLL